jgi:hypothetical protein
MKRKIFPASLLAMMAVAVLAWAEDQVNYFDAAAKKEVELKGTIDAESPAGIRVKTKAGVKDVPSADVRSVIYGSQAVSALEFRAPLGKEARALLATRPAERQNLLEEALKGYRELDARVKDEPQAHRYLQFKIANALALQAKDDPAKRDAAVAALAAYKTDFPGGWEVVPALRQLAQLLEDKGDAAAASAAYADLAALPDLPKEMRQESEVLAVRLLLRGGKYADAETKLKALQAGLAKDDPLRTFVDVYLVQSQMAQGNPKQAEQRLQAALRGTTDNGVRALAHNLLGDYYRLQKQPEEAFWHYLRVDVLYGQDREEHAKALYYLAQLFDKPKNDPVRAEECLTRLKGAEFSGTLYQRRVSEEKK